MADYWISFRIKSETISGRSYDDRYDDMMAVLDEHGSGFWDGDTSMVAIRTEAVIDVLGRAIKAVVSPTVDRVVMREIGKDSTRYIGEPGDGFLAFFPNAKRL